MSHIVKCAICQKTFDRDKIQAVNMELEDIVTMSVSQLEKKFRW